MWGWTARRVVAARCSLSVDCLAVRVCVLIESQACFKVLMQLPKMQLALVLWSVAVGCWLCGGLLAVGCWLLAVGCVAGC